MRAHEHVTHHTCTYVDDLKNGENNSEIQIYFHISSKENFFKRWEKGHTCDLPFGIFFFFFQTVRILTHAEIKTTLSSIFIRFWHSLKNKIGHSYGN